MNKTNSRLGIASVAIGVSIPIILIGSILLAALLGTRSGSAGNYIAIGAAIFAISAPVLHLGAAIMGFCGLLSDQTKNFLPIVGGILNIMLGTSGVLLIWLFISNIKFGFH